ncbi:MAG: hypothetical protein WCW27_02870 [Patescibacteria group bacterium]|jgi:hypothetical protein
MITTTLQRYIMIGLLSVCIAATLGASWIMFNNLYYAIFAPLTTPTTIIQDPLATPAIKQALDNINAKQAIQPDITNLTNPFISAATTVPSAESFSPR